MEKHNYKYSHIILVVVAFLASILCFGIVRELVFSIFIKINNGIYPPFMPSAIEVIRNCVGGFTVGLLSMIILSRNKYKILYANFNLLFVFIVLFKVYYGEASQISFYTLPYEVILSGAVPIILYLLVTKYMTSNKSFSRTRNRAG